MKRIQWLSNTVMSLMRYTFIVILESYRTHTFCCDEKETLKRGGNVEFLCSP
jgi:hypothetical protein